jgi:hypothetical protein
MGANQQMLMSCGLALLWDIGAHELGATGASAPAEFDVAGATYFAVAPAGYSYSAGQTTEYSTRKYNTLSAAQAALAASPTTPQVINIIGDWTGVTDSTQATFTGVSTTAANYILVRTIGAARHAGIYDTGGTYYKLLVANRCIRALERYLRFDGLLIKKISASSGGTSPVELTPGAGTADVRMYNCIVRGAANAALSEIGIAAACGVSQFVLIYNCVVYDISTAVASAAISTTGNVSWPAYVYSCIAIGGYRGIARTSGALVVKNCYAAGTNAAYSGTMTKTTCASADTTGDTGLQSIPHSTATFTNVTSTTEDYRLAVGSALIDKATKTNGEASPLNFTTDIAGKTR